MEIAGGKKLEQREANINTAGPERLTLKRETLRELTRAEVGPGGKPKWTTCTASPPQED